MEKSWEEFGSFSQNREMLCKCWDFGHGESKPAVNLGTDTALDLSPPSGQGVFRNKQLEPLSFLRQREIIRTELERGRTWAI